MKQAIIIGLVGLILICGINSAEAVTRLVKGGAYGTVGVSPDVIKVHKLQDGDVTCYISQHGNYGAHAISCVK